MVDPHQLPPQTHATEKRHIDYLSPTAIGGGFAATLLVVQQIMTPLFNQNAEILAKLAKLEGLAVRVEFLEKSIVTVKNCPNPR